MKNKIWIVGIIAIIMSVGLIVMGCDFFNESKNCHGEKDCIRTYDYTGKVTKHDSCGYDFCDVVGAAGKQGYSNVYCNCR